MNTHHGVLNWQEPWLLHEFSEDFYGEELRLIVVGYIRPEVSFRLNELHIIYPQRLLVPSTYSYNPWKTSVLHDDTYTTWSKIPCWHTLNVGKCDF